MIHNNEFAIEHAITDVLEKLDAPLTVEQIKKYIKIKYPEVSDELINIIINRMAKVAEIFIKDGIAHLSTRKVQRRMLPAFNVFLKFAKDAKKNFSAAQWPSQIVFVTDAVYKITVCESPSDENLLALGEVKQKDDVQHIIVGVNLKVSEINKQYLPNKDFIFAKMEYEDPTDPEPKIRLQKVKVTK